MILVGRVLVLLIPLHMLANLLNTATTNEIQGKGGHILFASYSEDDIGPRLYPVSGVPLMSDCLRLLNFIEMAAHIN